MTEKQSAKGRSYKVYHPPRRNATVRSLVEAWRAHRSGGAGGDAHVVAGCTGSTSIDAKCKDTKDAKGDGAKGERARPERTYVAEVGDRVLARFKGRARWYPGIVCAANADGTFAVDYDDGDKEEHVLEQHIRPRPGMHRVELLKYFCTHSKRLLKTYMRVWMQ